MGSRFFTIVQYGKETTHGTAVAATKMWPGQAMRVVTDSKPSYPVEQFNVRMESRRGIVYERLYQNTLVSSHAGFQQLLLPLGCGLKGGVTASEQTVGEGDYLWDLTPSLTGSNSPDSVTLEIGDDAQAWEVEYCMFNRISISGNVSQDGGEAPVSIEAEFFGRKLATTTFTGSLSLQSSTPMNAKKARLYVDSAWSGVGGTELSDLLRDFRVEILTGVHPSFAGSANDYFNAHKEGIIGFTAAFTIEGGSDAATLFAAQQAQSLQVVRLEINGPQIGAGVNHRLRIDMGGTWEDVTPIDNEDRGDNLATLALHPHYDDTGAKGLQVEVITNVNAY